MLWERSEFRGETGNSLSGTDAIGMGADRDVYARDG